MVANAVIQYGVNFVVGVVTPKNAFKTLIAANKPLVLIDASIKQYTKSIKHLTPLLQNSIKANFAWKDALFPIGLVNMALRRLVGTTRLATNQMAAELRGFTPRLIAAFNPLMAVQSIAALQPLLTPIIQQTARLGGTWASTNALIVDNAAQMGVMSTQYAELATQVARFAKSEEMIAAVTNSSLELAQATGLLPKEIAVLVDEVAKLASITKLSSNEIEAYNQAITAITVKLPVTTAYLNQFTTSNATLIKSNQLSIEEVTAYGVAFEQLGVAANRGSSVFHKLINILQTPEDLAVKGATGFEQLGYTIQDVTEMTAGEGGLNNALIELLTRIQGIANTDPSAAIQALSSLLGEDSDRGAGAQTIVALASSLGSLNSAMEILKSGADNAALSEELLEIAAQADPVGNLNAAFQGLTETWGTILQPLVLSVANDLAGLVNWLSGTIAASRDLIRGTMDAVINVSRVLDNTLRIIKPLVFYWSVFNASVATSKLLAIAFANVTKFLLVKNLFGLAVVTGFVSRQFNLLYVFLSSQLIPLLQQLTVASIQALPTAIWVSVVKLVKALPGLFLKAATAVKTFATQLVVGLKTSYAAIAPFLPLIIATIGAILAVRAAWLTLVAVMKKAKAIREDIESIKQTGDEVSASFKAIGVNADGSLSKTAGLWDKIADAANNTMEAIRDNLSIFEHIGNAIGNEQLAAFKFATQAEASANQAAIAYSDLLQTIDSYGATYSQVVAKIREDPNDYKTLEAGNSLLELLRKQKKTLELLEVTKDQAASKDAYIKSLDQQIRYVAKLTVGNDELKNSIDQAEVAVENMQQTLDNLRSKVSEELSKEVQKEIDLLTESAAKVEETEKAKVDAANDAAKKQFDAQEKQISRSQQLEDRSIERSRTKEDQAIEARQAAEDKAIEKRQAAEDAALQKQFDAKEAAIEKQQAAEDKAIEQRQAAEDKAIEQRQAAEDKAIERNYAAEDAALQKRYEAEDAALQKQLDKDLAAIEQATIAKEESLNREIKLKEEALQQQLDKDLAAIDLGLKAREEALAKELAAREAAINTQTETRVNNLEAQQAKALQAAEATFNAQQRAIDSAFELRKQQTEQAHKHKLIQQETAASARLQKLEEQFNTRQIDRQLAAVEKRKAKDLESISSREDAALKSFDRQQQLQNADSPEDRAKLQAEFDLADKIEAQRQAIRDKYEAERQAKEQETEKAKAALEAEKAKQEQELAAAKKKEEEKAAAEQAKLEAEKQAALDKLELEKEKAKQERQAAYDKQQEEIKLAFEAKLNEARTLAEQQLQALRTANEQLLEDARNKAEAQRNSLRLEHEKLVEQLRLETENKINELKLEAEKQAELLRLKAEEEKEKRELAREQAKEQRELKREEEAEQRKLQREEAAEKLKEQRELQAEQRAIKREAAKEARAEQFEAAKEQREQQREAAKEAREKQREEQAYQRQIKREDEDYARQLKREEEAAARQEAFEAAKEDREKQYEAAKAEREKKLAEEVANREAELAKELEVIKLQTQESIEQSYAEIVAGLKASADAIAAAAAAANKAASSSPNSGTSPGKRFKGGTVKAGLPYWVGEDRRTGKLTPNSELFIPKSAGYVANAAQVWGMIKAANYRKQLPPNIITTPTKTTQETKWLANLKEIQADVKLLAKTVNSRTNQLKTNQVIINPKQYELT